MKIPRGWRYHEKTIKLWSGGTTVSRRWTKHCGNHPGLDIKGWDCLHHANMGDYLHMRPFGVTQATAGFAAVLFGYVAAHGRLPTREEVEALPEVEAAPQ